MSSHGSPVTAVDHLADVARRWRRGLAEVAEVVAAAVDCLVDGVDAPALRELAGTPSGASYDVVAPLVVQALHELGWRAPGPGRTVGIPGLRAFLALVLEDAADLGPYPGMDVVSGAVLGVEHDDPGSAYLTVDGGFTMLVNGVDDHTPAEELEVVADRVHEWLVEELPSRHRSTGWPGCPTHPGTHPLWPRRHDDEVAWTCPATGHPHAQIGRLATLRRTSS